MNNPSYVSLRPVLENMAEEKYRAFHARLVPGIHSFLGVRIPLLRKLGRDLAREFSDAAEWTGFLEQVPALYEEVMLRGILIGLMPPQMVQDAARSAGCGANAFYFDLVSSQVQYLDNWALCDCFCAGLKQKEFLNDSFFRAIRAELLQSPAAGCWQIRTCLVLMLSHFTDEPHILQILDACRAAVRRLPDFRYEDTFYVRMGTAWLLAECYIKCRAETSAFLFGAVSRENIADDWTFNKAIQKIIESNRVGPDEKALLRSYKR